MHPDHERDRLGRDVGHRDHRRKGAEKDGAGLARGRPRRIHPRSLADVDRAPGADGGHGDGRSLTRRRSLRVQWRNDFSDALAIKALQLLFQYLPEAYLNPQDDASRERIHNAATMAGLAFSNSQLGNAHAMAHAIGAIFHVPHGRAISMVLPYVMEYNAREAKERYAEIARATGIEAASQEEGAEKLIEAVRSLSKLLSEPDSIRDGGISWERYSEELDRLVARALESTTTLADPRVPSTTDLKRLFIYAFKGCKVDF